ncbi:stalk domain-containing protein [Paenibacillus aceris]|uniref:FtsP/CotA-like multicopper oxidase with cupredoxin domain n=1 Tax=Paenibacillus aceris TaxID=869555 RepID=A0ABS4I2U0_9BACL|nr:stalk domain-containing protein [Paenibacillus aceris]MBP1965224.1 FtsP/CotA-like multicopper oxidase with cupredoxin domain [Paenibacillus aceris]NHW33200.1 multicopper oxidase domain-containing protein [Paenibacillus aceris]
MIPISLKRPLLRTSVSFVLTAIIVFIVLLCIQPYSAKADGTGEIKKFHLYATDGYLTLPDKTQVYVWGYSLQNEQGTAVFPAPPLVVNEGDQVEVTLTNIGPKKAGIKRLAHTIHFHGLDTDQANDGVPHTSQSILVGESFTYHFTAEHAGTYFYHCHVDTVEHLQMGMHGAFIVKAKDGRNQAWTGGPAYDREYTFVLNEIDPVWHKAVETGTPYDRTDFHPRYWTINGKAYPDTEGDPTTMIEGKVGETVLVRVINSGYQAHAMHLHGHHFQVIASDGRPLPAFLDKDTINVGSAERYDLLITFTQDGDFPFHSHNIVDNTNDGVYPGGLHTMVSIASAASKSIVLHAGDENVQADGQTTRLDVPPQLIGDTTYVPLRFIGNQLGADIRWMDEEKSVVYTTSHTQIQLWIDRNKVVINGKELTMDKPPINLNGTSMVPLRFVSENLGAKVRYDQVTGNITLVYDPDKHDMDMGTGMDMGTHMHTPDAQPSAPSPSHAQSGEPIITIDQAAFSVKELKVKAGTKVTWINKDTQIHTVTDLNVQFDSRNIAPGEKWSYTFTRAGTYTYYCSTHTSMQAVVIVE